MSAAILWRLAWGDFRDRVRSSRFLLVAVATAALGTLSVPQQGRYTTLTVGGYRGLYNSAWVGASVALVTTVFLSLFGFYLVNDAIRRDRQTGVGQVLAATPVTRTVYILSKVVSNFALLSILVAVLAVVAGVMQVLRGEAPVIEPWPLLAPFLLVTLPGLAVVSALAVLFESTRPLRGVLGNILYFFVWLSILGLSLSATESAAGSTIPDVFGVSLVLGAIRGAVRLYTSSTDFTLLEFGGAKPATFVWEGMAWSPQLIAARLIWIPLAALIVALAVPLFDRFDSPPPIQRISVRQREGAGPAPEALPSIPAWLREAPGDRCTFALAPMTVQELRLLLKEAGLWWHLGAVALTVLAYVVPEPWLHRIWLFSWLWPLALWSRLVTKETASRTEDLVLAAAHTVRHELPAAWLAGLLLALVTGSGALLRLALSRNWSQVAAGLVGAAFIPSLALALGAATRNEKPFQVLYLVLWYLGPAEGLPVLDFMGVHTEARLGVPAFYLIASLLLFAMAALIRWQQAYNR